MAINGRLPEVYRDELLQKLIENKNEKITCIFRVFAVNNDLVDFSDNLTILFKIEHTKYKSNFIIYLLFKQNNAEIKLNL